MSSGVFWQSPAWRHLNTVPLAPAAAGSFKWWNTRLMMTTLEYSVLTHGAECWDSTQLIHTSTSNSSWSRRIWLKVWHALHWQGILLLSICLQRHTATHTHTFNSPFSGTTRVSRYQKGKTNLDCTEARDSEWQWHQLGAVSALGSMGKNTVF